jgi:peptide/nickel transport system substrate-binding protein
MRPRTFHRREVLKGGALAGAALLGGGALLSCGDDDSPGTRDSTAASGTPSRGGTLRLGYSGPTAGETLYPLFPLTVVDVARAAALYDRLFVRASDFSIQPELVEEFEPGSDGLSYTIRVHDGVEFHHGKTLDADDLIFSFREWLDPERSETGTSLATIDGDRIEKLDERTIRLNLRSPDYLLQENLVRYGTIIVPADLDPENPVGCGPFKAGSFEPGVSSTFVRHDNYWQTDKPYFDELVMTGFAEESARLNALLSDQIDVMDQLSSSQVAQVQGASNLALLETEGGTVQPSMFAMDVRQPPFDDPDVRAAMRLLIDRQQLVDQVYGGRGAVGNDMWAPPDANYADGLAQRERDVDEARSLLRRAGHADLNLELIVSEYNSAVIPSAEVLAEQASEAGVNIELKTVTVNEWFDGYGTFPFVFEYWAAGSVTQQATFMLPGDVYDSTHWGETVPEFEETYEAAKSEPDEANRRELLQRCQELHHETGALIMWGFPNGIDGVSTKLSGFEPSKSGLSLNGYLGFKEGYFA